jgi:pyruvate/2-oxoglutarate dehydrogenase complex dihydrolipoamide dehydrogenase (E3) component
MKAKEYDLIAVGGGTAGLVSAAGAAYLGVGSALVEKAALGGDCLWTGCVPSKALLASARLAHAMRHADRFGLQAASPAQAFSSVMERMRRVRGVVEHHDDPQRFRDMGVTVEFGAARFVGRDTVDVEGVGLLRSKRIVIATGAVPAAPPIPGLAEAGYLDHHTLFDSDELANRIAVLGSGPIGLEMSQVFARLGAEVVVVEMASQILPREDTELAGRLQAMLEEEGITFRLDTMAVEVQRDGSEKVVVTDSGEHIAVDELFVATGRKPATDGLDLERAGVTLERGGVVVGDTLRTSNHGIWAAGDVTGGLQFTHVADYMAKTVLRNALIPGSAKVDYSTVPWVTYTDPELAHVGLAHEEAEARGGRSYSYELDDLDRAIVDGEARGLVKVTADRKGRVMGASILGSHAGELLLPLVLAMKHGLTLADISGTIFPYPTMMEGVKRTADAYQKARLEGTGGTVLRKVISWLK